MAITINCDIGEGYGLYTFGNDERIMPFISIANVACGFHASDPSVMHATVRLALAHGVKVGAHPSLPDRQGFGRREMQMEREELRDLLIYQVGALKGFLEAAGAPLNHIKPHGALFGMTSKYERDGNQTKIERRTSIHGGLEPLPQRYRRQTARLRGITANHGHLNLHPRPRPSFHTVWMV